MVDQTWHATSLHLFGNGSMFLLRRGTPRPYTRPVLGRWLTRRGVPYKGSIADTSQRIVP
ncbi:MAG: hypothetical protein HDR84_02825 [Bacteroides sp.]|nr:hypothetical protein [Bacteroidales bacterium]MBD5348167.1 hypothetical protein [Bacteroides sp.]